MKESTRYEHLKTIEISHRFYTGFYADIIFDHTEETYYLWLGHDHYGIKDMMIGLPKYSYIFRKHVTETLESILEYLPYEANESIPGFIEQRQHEDGHEWMYLTEEAKTDLFRLAAEIHDFFDEYDPYCGAYDSREEGIASVLDFLYKSPETIVENLEDIVSILEDEGDCFDWLTRAKELITKVNEITKKGENS